MKIAIVSDDGVYISQHFGRAMMYVVATIENNKVLTKEQRPKVGHHHAICSEDPSIPRHRFGYDPEAAAKHEIMAKSIEDCQMLIAGGMGAGAYEAMQNHHITTIVTDVNSINDALSRYLSGNLPHMPERID
jgi:predicted Fe-Mo cluster-binding NifX family protein